MPKNISVVDVKPRSSIVFDAQPKNSLVLDVKPKNYLIGEVDDIVTYLYRGMSMGPGWYMYVTYPETILVYP